MREGFQKRGMLTGQLGSTNGCRRGRQGREEVPPKTQGNADQRFSQRGCGLAVSASPGSLLEMSVPRPPLDQPHLWGGIQQCVQMSSPGDPDAHSSLRTTEWEWALFSLQLAKQGARAGTSSSVSSSGACLPLPPFCKPVPWGFGRSGAAHSSSLRLLRRHT